MRVDPKKLSEISRKTVEATATERAEAASVTAGQPAAAAQPDQVALSQSAADIQRARQALAAAPEVRQEKVAEAKRKLAEGAVEIDAEEIARKIVDGGV